ncbi:unnamed protein product, partial [Mesorhabditis belari]|uniref:Uncharacterized protein n=1 Tax=Mesorhabditis belari TaxID=2138241 RepID=A0AAF3F1L2_9BILA
MSPICLLVFLDRVGWEVAEKEDGQVSLLRGLLVGRLCKSGHQPSINKAQAMFNAYIESNQKNSRGSSPCTALIALGLTDPTSGRPEKLSRLRRGSGKSSLTGSHPNFCGSNLSLLLDKFGGANSGLFQRCMKLSAQESCNEEMAKDVETFFCGKIDATASATLDRPIKQVTEHIRNNVKFLAFAAPQADEYLKKKGY